MMKYDIIKCQAEADDYDFARFYSFNEIKGNISFVNDLKEASNLKNKSTLIFLKNYDFDIGSIKTIAERRKACFLVDLGALIRTNGLRRAILMSRLKTFLSHCNKYGAPYAFASFAEDKSQIRFPSELANIAMLLGINKGQARFAMRMLPFFLPKEK